MTTTMTTRMLSHGWPKSLSSSSTLQSDKRIIPGSSYNHHGDNGDGGITLCTESGAEAMVYVKYQKTKTMTNTNNMISSSSLSFLDQQQQQQHLDQQQQPNTKRKMFGRWRERRGGRQQQHGNSSNKQRKFKVHKVDSEYEWGEEKLVDENNDYEVGINNEDEKQQQEDRKIAAISKNCGGHSSQQVVTKSVVLEKGVTLTLTLTVCNNDYVYEDSNKSNNAPAVQKKDDDVVPTTMKIPIPYSNSELGIEFEGTATGKIRITSSSSSATRVGQTIIGLIDKDGTEYSDIADYDLRDLLDMTQNTHNRFLTVKGEGNVLSTTVEQADEKEEEFKTDENVAAAVAATIENTTTNMVEEEQNDVYEEPHHDNDEIMYDDDFDLEELNLEELGALAVQNQNATIVPNYNCDDEGRVLMDGTELNFVEAKAIVVLLQDTDLRRYTTPPAATPQEQEVAEEEDKKKTAARTTRTIEVSPPLAETTAVVSEIDDRAAAPLVSAVVMKDDYPDLEDMKSNDLEVMALLGTAKTSSVAVAVARVEEEDDVVVAKVNAMKLVESPPLKVTGKKEVDLKEPPKEDAAALLPNPEDYKGPDELEFVLPPGRLDAAFVGHPAVVTEIFEDSPLLAEGVAVGMMVDYVTIVDPTQTVRKKKKKIHYEMGTLRLTDLLKEHIHSSHRHIRFVAPHYIVTPPPIPTSISILDGCCADSVHTAITIDPMQAVTPKKNDNNSNIKIAVAAATLPVVAAAVTAVEENVNKTDDTNNNAVPASPAGGLVVSRVDSSEGFGIWTDSPVMTGKTATNNPVQSSPLATGVVISTVPDQQNAAVIHHSDEPKIDVWMDLPESVTSENEPAATEQDDDSRKIPASDSKSIEADLSSTAASCVACAVEAEVEISSVQALIKGDDNDEGLEIVSQMNYTWENLLGNKECNLPGEINCGQEEVSVGTCVSSVTQYTNYGMKKNKQDQKTTTTTNNKEENQGIVMNHRGHNNDDDDESDTSSSDDDDDDSGGDGDFSC
eukprot:CAMPEP_0194132790 /NCGR_PEP_ID=MMETSP0152-20130528/3178_1 /TAXON_ID=1049557 /ORGANISM="Thalassiothrix antarctica, Strain L6-D1" /LENGTH=1009 /DNA_ID=CAMNT_0038827961 /DNA_START=54 /DNA_END=3083 /DNA_ORIENTATION=-